MVEVSRLRHAAKRELRVQPSGRQLSRDTLVYLGSPWTAGKPFIVQEQDGCRFIYINVTVEADFAWVGAS